MSYWRETVWSGRNHEPYIAVHNPERYGREFAPNNHAWTDSMNSWTWKGCEGKETAVEVYSDAEEMELIVNGRSLGRKSVGNEFKQFYCRWNTVYMPGEVTAVAYIDGTEVGRSVLRTAGKAKLCTRADKTILHAGSDELSYVEIELRDDKNVLNMNVAETVSVKAEGQIKVWGCGSADPVSEESFQAEEHRIFEGRLLAVVKALENPGVGRLIVTVNGTESEMVDFNII